MSSADLVPRTGFGVGVVVWSRNDMMSARSATPRCGSMPRLILRSVMSPKWRSTWLSHEALVERQMHMPARPLGQPVAGESASCGWRNCPSTRWTSRSTWNRRFDLMKEFAELAGAMAAMTFADRGAGGDVQTQRTMTWSHGACSRGFAAPAGRGAWAASAGCGGAPGDGVFRPRTGRWRALAAPCRGRRHRALWRRNRGRWRA